MPKTKGGVVGRGMSDSLMLEFSINRRGTDTKTGFTSATFTTSMIASWFNTGVTKEAITLPGPFHLDKVVVVGRAIDTSTLATTLMINDGSSLGNHGDAGIDVRVQKAEAATPRTFANIIDNSINGADVINTIRYPFSATTARQPRTITYRGEPQVRGAGSGWTGTTADDCVVGDRFRIQCQATEVVSTVDHFYVYCIFSSRE